ncbi:FAD-binding oxidoreductase [Thalassospira sp. HF15]|uniref:NAD(P)/FAD-dependent oxidoreductase n=1 Tax=Thalassospira sp. HF15 TaxID=2722755 RepID=UPI001431309A|nr:FAD-binding oxidoreductase [Thalassospira sp. HF15]NIY76795.1 FAD-binding oxidoreductase [Thalassospira sp. HF15]
MKDDLTSLWEATASDAPETVSPKGEHVCDVMIIGGGFTGMSCALQLAKGGASVIVVDAVRPGFGASGRNGGQVIPGLKHDPDTLDQLYGEYTTEFVGKTAETTFDLIKQHGIDCDATPSGWIQGSVKRDHLGWLETRMREWQSRGADVRMLDTTEIQSLTGSERLVGGWFDNRAGQLHPLKYIRGLTRAAQGAGCQVFAPAVVQRVKSVSGKWHAEIADTNASIKSDHLVVATNGYSGDLFPKLRKSLIPVNSFQVATAPLGEEQLAKVLPTKTPVSDSRRIGNYFRIGPGGRLMIGGRGTFTDPVSRAAFQEIISELHAYYPWVKSVPLEFYWAGRLAMTYDHFPHLHRPVENMTMAVGYNGRGVALSTSLGKAIADNLLAPDTPLPLRFRDISPLIAHDMHRAYATIAIWYYRLRDYLES